MCPRKLGLREHCQSTDTTCMRATHFRDLSVIVKAMKRVVPRVGLEPTPLCRERILSPPRLPFRHPGSSDWWKDIKSRSLIGSGVFLKMEATGGFEPPNRGFADLRLSPLGYVALIRWWCRGRDLNPHGLTPTTPSRWRVYQFHHLGQSRPLHRVETSQ